LEAIAVLGYWLFEEGESRGAVRANVIRKLTAEMEMKARGN
jgi:hypothetical protein